MSGLSQESEGCAVIGNVQVPLTPRSDAADGSAAVLGAARDERRLAALGRRTVEVYVVSHLFLEHLAVRYVVVRRQITAPCQPATEVVWSPVPSSSKR